MLNFKKRLHAILPGEGARGALQDALTMDWSGHKTVLFQVPSPGTVRSNEVELAGMDGRNDGDYGRLMDQDEDERAYLANTSSSDDYFFQSHGQPRPALSTSIRDHRDARRTFQSSSKKDTSAMPNMLHRPNNYRVDSNPFRAINEMDESDSDFAPKPLPTASCTLDANAQRGDKRTLRMIRHSQRRNTFSVGSTNITTENPWAGRGWVGVQALQGPISPASSRGTGDSATPTEENPFR